MKTPHKAGIAAIVALCALFLVGAVWSLGAGASEDVPLIRIEKVTAPVEIKHPGEASWTALDATTAVQIGDEIRTGSGGKAKIRWGDRGETRLDADTELTIEAAPMNANATTKALVQLKLTTGRVWSRVLKLLDMDSGFEVKTQAVVATVRGTAFGVASTPVDDQLAVTESVVNVASSRGGSSMMLPEGMWGSFNASGTPNMVRELTPADAWPRENKIEDEKFDEELRKEIEARFQKQLSNAPEWLVSASERLHLALAPADAESDLLAKYIGRDIARAAHDPSRAKTVLQDQDAWLQLKGTGKESVLRDIRFALFLQEPRVGFTPSANLVTVLQDLRTRILSTTSASGKYAIALNVDDRIDALLNPPSPLGSEEKKQRGETLLSEIASWREGVSIDTGLSVEERTALESKADALRARLIENGLVGAGATTTPVIIEEPKPTTLKDVPLNPSPTSANNAVPSTTTPIVTDSSSCSFRSFVAMATPNANVHVGEPVKLSLTGLCVDGSVVDVTTQAAWSFGSANDGSFEGSVFVPAHDGLITLFAAYVHDGITGSAKTTISVSRSPRQLVSISVGATGPITLATGQSAPLTATAFYSDGSTSDVVYQCIWTSSDSRLAFVSGQRVYAGTGSGQVTISCAYTEGSMMVVGSRDFTIQLDSALTPTTGATQPARTFTNLPLR